MRRRIELRILVNRVSPSTKRQPHCAAAHADCRSTNVGSHEEATIPALHPLTAVATRLSCCKRFFVESSNKTSPNHCRVMSTPPNLRSATVRDAPAVVSPVSRRHRTRSDSIPEGRQANSNLLDDADRELEALLMRHSSPLAVIRPGSAGRPLSSSSSSNPDAVTGAGDAAATAAAASPTLLERRNSSPSPLRLNRPRSNPRNRTPMLYEDPQDRGGEGADAAAARRNEGRRMTIRPGAGAAVGTHLAVANRVSEDGGLLWLEPC